MLERLIASDWVLLAAPAAMLLAVIGVCVHGAGEKVEHLATRFDDTLDVWGDPADQPAQVEGRRR